MSAAGMPNWSLRVERAESSRLAWAFTISVALHLLTFGSYETGKRLGWWQNWHWPPWLQSAKMLTEMLKKKENTQPPQQRQEVPLMFVDVSPAQATPEPPKTTPYYSDKNSRAANPERNADTEVPKITGQQTQIVRTEDVPRTRAFPLQPALPTPPSKEAQEEAKPKAAYTPGDLTMAKPDQTPRKAEGEAEHQRPKTLAEVKARTPNSQLSGEKVKQEGGVKRIRVVPSYDVMATPFGTYDAAIIAAVQNRWYDLLDSRNYARDRTGKVTLRFHLNADGGVSEIAFMENTVDLALGLLCQSAIKDPAPFAPWPSDLRRLVGADYREVTFTFFYN